MPVSESYKTFVRDLLAEFGAVDIRAMFGGAGVYRDGVMFAIIAGETLYLKADETSCGDFEAESMGPFTYEAKGKTAVMSYWEVPERLYDDPEEFADWARKAFAVACKRKS